KHPRYPISYAAMQDRFQFITPGMRMTKGRLRTGGFPAAVAPTKASSSEVDTGSRKENDSKQESRAPFRFNRNGKGSRVAPPPQSRRGQRKGSGNDNDHSRAG